MVGGCLDGSGGFWRCLFVFTCRTTLVRSSQTRASGLPTSNMDNTPEGIWVGPGGVGGLFGWVWGVLEVIGVSLGGPCW